jgi:hypothetical protein
MGNPCGRWIESTEWRSAQDAPAAGCGSEWRIVILWRLLVSRKGSNCFQIDKFRDVSPKNRSSAPALSYFNGQMGETGSAS